MTHLVYPPAPTQTHTMHHPIHTHQFSSKLYTIDMYIPFAWYSPPHPAPCPTKTIWHTCWRLPPTPTPPFTQTITLVLSIPLLGKFTKVLGLTIGKNSQIIPYFFTENFNTFTCFVYIQRIDLLCRHTYTILVSYVCGFKADLHSFNKSPPKRSVLADMTNWRTICTASKFFTDDRQVEKTMFCFETLLQHSTAELWTEKAK